MPSKGGGDQKPQRSRRQRAIRGQIVMDKETARRVHLARWRRFVLGFLAVSLLCAAIGLYTSPLLRVQKIQVVGASSVSVDEVNSLARLNGNSMLRLDLASAEQRVETIPMVASARLERRWPQTIRVVIEERKPWAFWQAGADRFVIDSEGVVLPGSVPLQNGPIISDLSGPLRLSPGDRVDRDTVVLARTLFERLPQELGLNVGALEYSPQQGLAITTDGGYRVVLGDSQNVDHKLAVWQAIEGRLGRETMAGHVLDLRFGDRPSFQ